MILWAFYLRNLHQLFNHIASENVIENYLKKLVVNDWQFQLVSMPDENFGLIDRGDGDLEVVVGADAEIFRRVKEMMSEDDVKRFLVLWNDESRNERIWRNRAWRFQKFYYSLSW